MICRAAVFLRYNGVPVQFKCLYLEKDEAAKLSYKKEGFLFFFERGLYFIPEQDKKRFISAKVIVSQKAKYPEQLLAALKILQKTSATFKFTLNATFISKGFPRKYMCDWFYESLSPFFLNKERKQCK